MKKKSFAIIGNPISHSLSPFLHKYWFDKYNIEASYTLLNIEERDIKNVIKRIRNKELDGINVTLPYKQKVIPFIDKIFFIRLMDVPFLSLNSTGPTSETFFCVTNFKEFGFGVCCV